ncbi:hypothetical protein THAOC_36571, partial [Thalassiosira oceanica]
SSPRVAGPRRPGRRSVVAGGAGRRRWGRTGPGVPQGREGDAAPDPAVVREGLPQEARTAGLELRRHTSRGRAVPQVQGDQAGHLGGSGGMMEEGVGGGMCYEIMGTH